MTNTRDRGEDGRERAYEGRDHTGDPRDVFLHDIDLPLDPEREYVLDRGSAHGVRRTCGRPAGRISIARCRELLGEEADSMTDEDVDLVRRHAESMAALVVELYREIGQHAG